MFELFMIAVGVGIVNAIRLAMTKPGDPNIWLITGLWTGFAWTLLAIPALLFAVAIWHGIFS